jgi:two-component system sensor histidine kinase/response regulator
MLKALRVLLVEDTPLSAEVAGEILRAAGHSCDVVVDGFDAVEAVLRSAYDLVLMDCQLPRLDGYEATRRIRALEANRKLPTVGASGALHGERERLVIVALTACTTAEHHDRALRVGMDDFLTKPVDARQLLSAIERHVAR